MRLSTRLTAVLVTVTMAVAVAVGWYSVAASTRADYATIDAMLNSVAASGAGHPLTALSSALALVQQNNDDVTLDVLSPDGTVAQLATGTIAPKRTPSLADARRALGAVTTSPDLPGFRYRSLAVGGGDVLVVAASTHDVAARSRRLLEGTIGAGLLAAALVAVASRVVIRRDLRTIERLVAYAGDVAGGDLDRPPPPAEGSTDIRMLRESLAHMVRSLHTTIEAEQRVARVTQRFIGDASHELRTPLTVVRGYAELLARPGVDEEQRARALDRVAREVARMDTLVGDLLFLAEVGEGSAAPDVEVDLSALVASAVADFALDHPARPLTYQIDNGLRVRARPGYLERIVHNALANVVRHTSAADEVRVSLREDELDAVLVVEDAGPGLPPDAYGETPERFRRFDEARARATGGSGLGMSIMSDVARALGGSFTTSRSELGGLAVSVRLPLAPAPPR